ncbi:hypothetical protein [Streptomyces sp. 3N207]|uniref:hypothetical protein n=1 Tax=Streptomyces sp. 3N207 TaxID=3457417 RepID=UPI003FCF5D6F
MNATAHSPAPPIRVAARRDRSRLWSVLCAIGFAPATVAAGVLTLASERASRCLTYGEQCEPGLPDWLFTWGLGLGTVACLIALAAPVARVRQAALTTQVLAECAALLEILSHA